MKEAIFKKIVPKSIRLKWLKNKIIAFLESQTLADDEKQVLDFLKKNKLTIFPYSFPEKYDYKNIPIEKDPSNGFFYTFWEGKKLYFKNGKSKKRAQIYFNSLLLEQDPESPHCYLEGDFEVQEGEIIVDVGAAEGNFSLSAIEKAAHCYIFETEPSWITALEATFAPYKDKVTIVEKYVSDHDDEKCIKLDTYFKGSNKVTFIKADVEGAEGEVLRGAEKLIQNQKNLKVAVCTYHRQVDAKDLFDLLEKYGFENRFSRNYMIYYYGKTNVVQPPYLRRAVLRAVKKS
ncbi:MAG: FkbM family methyltransferase [Spirosomataceae bacterium]